VGGCSAKPGIHSKPERSGGKDDKPKKPRGVKKSNSAHKRRVTTSPETSQEEPKGKRPSRKGHRGRPPVCGTKSRAEKSPRKPKGRGGCTWGNKGRELRSTESWGANEPVRDEKSPEKGNLPQTELAQSKKIEEKGRNKVLLDWGEDPKIRKGKYPLEAALKWGEIKKKGQASGENPRVGKEPSRPW